MWKEVCWYPGATITKYQNQVASGNIIYFLSFGGWKSEVKDIEEDPSLGLSAPGGHRHPLVYGSIPPISAFVFNLLF